MHKNYQIVIAITLALSGCIKSATVPLQQRPSNWASELNNHYNFYQVSSGVYRSEQPNKALISELKKHDIDVVVNLRSHHTDQKILDQHSFKLVHIPIRTWAIDREDLLNIMLEIQRAKANNQKILIHCYHGADRTGASIAMYRIIFEGWKTEDAVREMKHGGYGFHKIWVNIDQLFTHENIRWIQRQLSNPSSITSINP